MRLALVTSTLHVHGLRGPGGGGDRKIVPAHGGPLGALKGAHVREASGQRNPSPTACDRLSGGPAVGTQQALICSAGLAWHHPRPACMQVPGVGSEPRARAADTPGCACCPAGAPAAAGWPTQHARRQPLWLHQISLPVCELRPPAALRQPAPAGRPRLVRAGRCAAAVIVPGGTNNEAASQLSPIPSSRPGSEAAHRQASTRHEASGARQSHRARSGASCEQVRGGARAASSIAAASKHPGGCARQPRPRRGGPAEAPPRCCGEAGTERRG
jgi:hypothetical protein